MSSDRDEREPGAPEVQVTSGTLGGEIVPSDGDPSRYLDVHVRLLLVPTTDPPAIGSVLALDVRLGHSQRRVRTLARVHAHRTATPGGPITGAELELLGVWGKRASQQVLSYLDDAEAAGTQGRGYLPGAVVLVVDDDATYRNTAAEALRDSGFDVVTAENGIEGLSLALKHQPSAIVSDVTMPGMDGWQLLRLLRARPTLRRTPFVFLTDLVSEQDRIRGYQLGVDDYLHKPFSSVELIARVERLLERVSAVEGSMTSSLRGDLSKMPLASLLSLSEMERRSGVLVVTRDGETATLHLRDGAVIRIDLAHAHDTLEGIARFFHVLDWPTGRFELTAGEVRGDDTLGLPTSFVLLEHARTQDEASG
jgi:DNA-binding response OmpR family regulator